MFHVIARPRRIVDGYDGMAVTRDHRSSLTERRSK
jgi:hypothetical protein